MAKDFYGRELTDGDLVIFSVGRNGGSTLREGVFLKEHESGRITIRPTTRQGGTKITRHLWLDIRTAKFVYPYDHVAVPSHYVHKVTREPIQPHQVNRTLGREYNYAPNPDHVPAEDREYVKAEFASYLLEITIPGGPAVVLRNADNVVKI